MSAQVDDLLPDLGNQTLESSLAGSLFLLSSRSTQTVDEFLQDVPVRLADERGELIDVDLYWSRMPSVYDVELVMRSSHVERDGRQTGQSAKLILTFFDVVMLRSVNDGFDLDASIFCLRSAGNIRSVDNLARMQARGGRSDGCCA